MGVRVAVAHGLAENLIAIGRKVILPTLVYFLSVFYRVILPTLVYFLIDFFYREYTGVRGNDFTASPKTFETV
jgi:hypothetical protein